MTLPFSAVVLAAGRSSRMGREKALLADAAGQPLWKRQREVLARAGAREIFLSARPDQAWTATTDGFTAILPDIMMDGGPLAGLVSAQEVAVHPHLAVLAVDLPRLEARWWAALLALSEPGVGAVGRRGNFFEPLAAIYPAELLPSARAALVRGERSLQRLIADAVARGLLRVRECDDEDGALFENWNEARDLR